jgi:hypothetical protein
MLPDDLLSPFFLKLVQRRDRHPTKPSVSFRERPYASGESR